MVDKNQAVIDYLLTCPAIVNSPLYFNFINAQNDTNQFLTSTSDMYTTRRYIDGSATKIYIFSIITFKSVADIALPKLDGYESENVSDMATIQQLIDWISEQEELKNYPNFGEDCEVDEILTTTDNPHFDGVDNQVSPPLAVYSVTIQIRYIDRSKMIWR